MDILDPPPPPGPEKNKTADWLSRRIARKAGCQSKKISVN
jgi:hypothetical protein